ncbi:unnamed protein product (macronuclear) [Paramecium tetraurelia]|uniref:Uncharacterized protein n=1 Tax=Paramecium tetraurelia TaxID=5888 RepID=A0CNL3_PARTE|nr:uncharacterized protein GSPATT00008822001 [Paramecium tetraurelia]CAK72380.1 unnamed protein product [Paramecium tetraurelia]|eukprot:XP_001439777.1 hypothetical protein (macronuclear) [Paramecium tetraurelia strain d4-2]
MSVKKQSYAGSTTDYSEAMFQPNFTQRNQGLNQNYQLPTQNQQFLPQQPFQNQRISFGQGEFCQPQQTIPKQRSDYNFQPQYPVTDLNSTFTMLPKVFEMDQDFLPQEILFLLSEENNHIDRFKKRVDREKEKIKRDISSIKSEISNMIEDLGVQMQQFVDEHYKRYLNVYAAFKDEVIQFKKTKLEAPLNLVPPPPSNNFGDCSNANLIRELEEMKYQNYVSKVNAYISNLAKQRVEQIQIISKELLQLTSQNSEFYHSEATLRQLNNIKQEVEERLITKFGDMTDYILPLDFMEQSQQKQMNQEIKSKLNLETQSLPQSAIKTNPYLNIQEPKLTLNFENQMNQFNQSSQTIQQSPILQLQNHFLNTHTIQGKVNELQEIQSQDIRHNGMILCFTNIKENLIATGSKDTCINIWDNYSLISQLKGHTDGVCTLTVIKANNVPFFLASGSDNGDKSIKIWNLSTLKEHNTLVEHQAAVVALLSLDDGQTLVSGSYDKSLLIWNIDNQKPIQRLDVHTNAVTCLTLAKGRFISGGLDQTINVWKIIKNAQGQFQSAQLERTIRNQTLVCALNIVQIQNNTKIISGGKDGKIREFDINTGELLSQQQVTNGPIVEMIVAQDYVNYSVISMSNKDRNLVMTSQGVNKVLDTNDQVFVEFGCGVYPKIEVVEKAGQLQLNIISQKQDVQKIFKYAI